MCIYIYTYIYIYICNNTLIIIYIVYVYIIIKLCILYIYICGYLYLSYMQLTLDISNNVDGTVQFMFTYASHSVEESLCMCTYINLYSRCRVDT